MGELINFLAEMNSGVLEREKEQLTFTAVGFSLLHLVIPPLSLTLSFDYVCEYNISCCHVSILLRSFHLSLLCSPRLLPLLFPLPQGGSAGMRCWVHGN